MSMHYVIMETHSKHVHTYIIVTKCCSTLNLLYDRVNKCLALER